MVKNIKIFIVFLIIIFVLIFFIQFTYKSIIIGNNIIKSDNDLIEYILNFSSYEAKIEVTINSNKTTNKYVLKQYYMEPNYSKQIVLEPNNIENLEIIYNGKNLEVKNTNFGLSKIYENYTYLSNNVLWLNFIKEICNKGEYIVDKKEDYLILKFNIEETNNKGELYLDKKTNLPIKIEVFDDSNKSKIYIEYKEIKLNNIQENNIFAFKYKDIKKEV